MCGRNPDMSAGEFGVTSYQSKVWRTWRTGGLFLRFFNNKITAILSSFKKTTVMFQIIFWAAVWKCSAQRLWFQAWILTMCRCELPVVSVSVNRCTMQLNIKQSSPLTAVLSNENVCIRKWDGIIQNSLTACTSSKGLFLC